MDYFNIVGGTVLAFCVGGIFSLVGVTIGGLFVLRTKRDGYEPLMPPLRDKEMTAYNLDEFEHSAVGENIDASIERILSERREEDPAYQANTRFKEQL